MISHTLRASRLGIARLARQQAFTARRTFVTSTVRQADIVQDMYLKELKAYKVPQPKAGDEKGSVQEFSPPAAPESPEEGDLTSELSSYESGEVEVEGGTTEGESASSVIDDWFEKVEEEESIKEQAEQEH